MQRSQRVPKRTIDRPNEGKLVPVTVELPEKLWLAAKLAAVEARTTLRALIVEGLTSKVEKLGKQPKH